MPAPRLLAALLLPALGVAADWTLARNTHVEVYSQDGEAAARSALHWIEQLRATVRQETGLEVAGRTPVRVIGFHSETEYARYRMTPTADAYFVAAGDRNYIVMPSLGEEALPLVAHEYAHLIQHAASRRFPPWLSEGLADLFSTLRIDRRGSRIGGALPGRLAVLHHTHWMPLEQLMTLPANSPLRDQRATSALFYAESWALTAMLALSPAYRPCFSDLTVALAAGADGPAALQSACHKPLHAAMHDLTAWVAREGSKPTPLATPEPDTAPPAITQIPGSAVQLLMAELFLITGDLNGAESAYRDIARETGESAEVWAGLGTVATARKHDDEARKLWKRAVELGVRDSAICYRYAELLDSDPSRRDDRRAALERAVALRPDFDDARWMLALLEQNSNRPEAALSQLQAMREIAPARAFAYWCAMADTLTALGRGGEAKPAAERAAAQAATAEERASAARLAYIAETHLAVRFTRDAAGNPQMVTTRVPNNAEVFNPFIEPADDLRRVRGTLLAIECGQPALRITLDTADGKLSLTIPDPARVQMRHAPEAFVCGPQPGNPVLVEYAALKDKEGIVRGVEFQ
jgi:tetratricopeptide (TPR) repeat protein